MVINRIDIRRTYSLIDNIANQAFIIEFEANNVKGEIPKVIFEQIKHEMKRIIKLLILEPKPGHFDSFYLTKKINYPRLLDITSIIKSIN